MNYLINTVNSEIIACTDYCDFLKNEVNIFLFFAHLAEGNVSFCHHLASVVVCCPSSVVR